MKLDVRDFGCHLDTSASLVARVRSVISRLKLISFLPLDFMGSVGMSGLCLFMVRIEVSHSAKSSLLRLRSSILRFVLASWQPLANVVAVLSVLWFRFRMIRRYLASLFLEVSKVYHLLKNGSGGVPSAWSCSSSCCWCFSGTPPDAWLDAPGSALFEWSGWAYSA